MIQEVRTYRCRLGGSPNIIKNGRNRYGSQQDRCKDCGACRVLEPRVRDTHAQREHILQAYQERGSLRAIRRVFGVAVPPVLRWIHKKSLPSHP